MLKNRLALAATALLGGCTVGPDYRPPETGSLNVPTAYSVETAQAAPVELSLWWRQFNDPLLTDLIGRATAANLDIAVSEGRLRQARESLIQANAALLPSLSGSAGVTHNMTYAPTASTSVGGTVIQTGGNSAATQLSLGLDASWQVDIFGGTRRSIEAARANADNAAFNLAAIRTSVAGEVATNYITARLAQARLAIARDTLKTQDDNLEIAGWRVKAGLVSSVDV